FLLSDIKKGNPKAIALCWDSKYLYKREIDPNYRKEREEPEDLNKKDFEKTLEILKSLGIVQLKSKGWEADQLIAALANSLDRALILSDDKDFFQLLEGKKKILKGEKRGIWTFQEVKTEYGLNDSKLFGDFQALAGDKIDNVPSIFSEKEASKIINKKGALNEWFFKHDFVNLSDEQRKIIENNYDRIKINYELVYLRDEKIKDEMFYSKGETDYELVYKIFKKEKMKRFLNRLEEFEKLQEMNILKFIKKPGIRWFKK
ncbi:MAG: hypothetical protein ACTSVV_01985, partial [Promethearchaeota archaeon]